MEFKSSRIDEKGTDSLANYPLTKVKRPTVNDMTDCILYAAKMAKKHERTFLVFPTAYGMKICQASDSAALATINHTGGWAITKELHLWRVESSGTFSTWS